MKLTAPIALALCLTLPVSLAAQQAATPHQHPFTDPANLGGERVTPLNGHELPIDQGALGLAELLRKLSTRASILNIVAHPDDEDGGMLTLYARGMGARVADLALTRGEGGQNFVTGDFEDALGLIRTQELLANDRYTGVTQMFGTEVDFGFSKTREESFHQWGHQRVLYDAVRAIRIYRPLVITATFIGNVTDGHGQHQVSGEIAQEAFKAAADPNVFPDMIREGILPWQALKIYARVPFASIDSKGVYDYATNEYVPARFTNYVTGKVTTTKPNADIEVPEGDSDPLLTSAAANPKDIPATLSANPTEQLSYMQFARIGLSLQRTQISKDMRLPTSGPHNSGYTLYGSVLCNAPANAKYTPPNSVILSVARSAQSKDPCISPAPANISVILSGADRAFASSAVEGPRTRPVPTLLLTNFDPNAPSATAPSANGALYKSPGQRPGYAPTNNPKGLKARPIPIMNASSQPERSAVERPMYLATAYSPTNPSTQPAPSIDTNRYPEPSASSTDSHESSNPDTNRYPEASASGLMGPEEKGVLTPGYALPNKPTNATTPSDATTPSANGAPHTSLGRSPRKNPNQETQGLKARFITASFAPSVPPPQTDATTPTDLTTAPNFFTGIDTSIEAIATLAPSGPPFIRYQLARMANNIAKATRDFNPNNPSAIAPPLAAALHTDDALIGLTSLVSFDPLQKANILYELRIKQVQLNEALTLALGLQLDATAPSSNIIENTALDLKTSLTESSAANLTVEKISIDGAPPNQQQTLYTPRPLTHATPITRDDQLPANHLNEITQPYFYRDNIEQPVYKLRNPALRNAPQTPAPLIAWATVTYQGTEITLARVVHNGPQPISIIPPVSISSAPSATVLPTNQTTTQLTATLTTEAHTSANINVQSPHNWTIQAKAIPAPATDLSHSINFYLHPTAPVTDPAIFRLTATTPDHHTYTEGWRPVGYPGLILTNYYTPATTRVVPVDLKLPQHDRIAYLPGTGDAVPQALTYIGLTPTLITVADLTPANLTSFDTVILGVRTYSAHPDLQGVPTKALLDFARNGGNVVVQYQTSDFTSADAPYPLDLGPGAKVVVETDPVQLLTSNTTAPPSRYPEPSGSGLIKAGEKGVLTPGYALLNIPNKITPADFNNWIEERGHGFLETWDPHYTPLTETHDPGGDGTLPQSPQRGGLITAQVGKGRWTYVAFALYRQLPEAVPGAYRLFVNLITPPHLSSR